MSEKVSYTEYIDTIAECPLFKDIPVEKIEEMILFLNGFAKTFKKGETLVRHGEPFRYAGIILKGKVEVSYTNYQFDKLNVNHFTAPNVFGEALAIKKISYSPIQVDAIADCIILFIDLNYLMCSKERCCSACTFNHQLLLNLTSRMADQNIFTNLKLRILSQKSLRDKIIVYLYSLQPDNNNVRTIPFSQTALAEFLNVNRSALSRELGRMQDENIIWLNGKACVICE